MALSMAAGVGQSLPEVAADLPQPASPVKVASAEAVEGLMVIDLLMGLCRGAVFQHGVGTQKQPISLNSGKRTWGLKATNVHNCRRLCTSCRERPEARV